jgi:hypothetical protein
MTVTIFWCIRRRCGTVLKRFETSSYVVADEYFASLKRRG